MRPLLSSMLALATLSFVGLAVAQEGGGTTPSEPPPSPAPAGDTPPPAPAPAPAEGSANASASASAGASASVDGVPSPGSAPRGDNDPGPLVLGAEIGAIFPQPFSELGTHVAVGIEVGYKLPFWERRLEIMAAAGYTPPANSGTVTRREGAYQVEIDQQMLHFSLGPRLRVMEHTSPWNVTLALGGRLFLLKTLSNGSRNGAAFAEFSEQSTQMGFFFAVGGEYRLGPGALFLDLDVSSSSLPHKITGTDVTTGNIMATLGYRFFLL